MSDGEHESSDSFSIEDDKIIWTRGSCSDADFVVLHHPLLDAHSFSSTLLDATGHHALDSGLSPAFDKISLCDHDPLVDCLPTSGKSNNNHALSGKPVCTNKLVKGNAGKTKCRTQPSGVISASFGHHNEATTPTASFDDASAFITRFISSPVKTKDAELNLLRALIIELGVRSPNAPDLPSTLTRARKMLRAEVYINIKEYVATRHKGQSALRDILKPNRNALRKNIKKGNGASLQWVKQHGLQVLLVTCFK